MNRTHHLLTTNIERVESASSAISGIDICGKYRAYQVAQMRYVVHVRQSAGDEYIALFSHFVVFGEDNGLQGKRENEK